MQATRPVVRMKQTTNQRARLENTGKKISIARVGREMKKRLGRRLDGKSISGINMETCVQIHSTHTKRAMDSRAGL